MAILKVVPPSGKYKDMNTYEDVITYVLNPKKTPHNLYIARGVRFPKSAAMEMRTVSNAFRKTAGTKIRHSILSFSSKDKIEKQEAYEIACKITDYYADEYQIIAAVHEDKPNLHIHTIMNTTNFVDGKKYTGQKNDYYSFLEYIRELLYEKNISFKVK